MENTYWNHKGKFQQYIVQLDRMIPKDIPEGKMYEAIKTFYYRRYNDGDMTCPQAIVFNALSRKFHKHGMPKLSLSKNLDAVRLETLMDATIQFLIERFIKKQVTVVMQIAVTMEVPVTFGQAHIEDMIKNHSTIDMELNCNKFEPVEVSDILDITSYTEVSIAPKFATILLTDDDLGLYAIKDLQTSEFVEKDFHLSLDAEQFAKDLGYTIVE